MTDFDLLEGGTVVSASENGIVVDIDGVEVYVSTRISYTACECCGDMAYLSEPTYNRLTDHRVAEFGEEDPLGLDSD